jgi:hypothetical protein
MPPRLKDPVPDLLLLLLPMVQVLLPEGYLSTHV